VKITITSGCANRIDLYDTDPKKHGHIVHSVTIRPAAARPAAAAVVAQAGRFCRHS
jgi:hypothetical protein